MSIYRGSGGSGDANTDATINEVTELVQDALGYKNEAATSASNAATSASNAATSESNASTSETNASSSETNAATSETNAATSETNAATSATSAATSASNASTSETNASSSASTAISAASDAAISETNASASATSASSSASTATTQAGIATTKASEASTSATNAATSETNAANSATSAATSATNAANSASTAISAASDAAISESNASTSETNAAASATSASSSASSASSSATSAAGSATTATTKASEASTSASNASTSETNAANSASAASTSATNASTSESNAATSATNAASSASAAATSASDAAASAASIDTSSFVVKSNNLSDLNSASTALTNLGIANHDDITVDGSGNVGIGTSSPSAKLHLQGAGAAAVNTDFIYRPSGDNTNNYQIVGLYNLSGSTSGAFPNQSVGFSSDVNGGFGVSGGFVLNTDTDGGPLIFGTSNTERMRIDSSGNVGIGTSSPISRLSISDPAGSATSISLNCSPDSTTANWRHRLDNVGYNGRLLIRNNSSVQTVLINSVGDSYLTGGNVGIGTSSPSAIFHTLKSTSGGNTDSIWKHTFDTNWGIELEQQHVSGSHIQWNWKDVANNNLMTWKLGNVGIGTSSPSSKLHVSGDITATGNLKFNSGYGSVATAYGCRAWVNFNGTGTVAIRASGNVSSITDNGTGFYAVNFTTSMPDTNYCVSSVVDANATGDSSNRAWLLPRGFQTNYVTVNAVNDGGARADNPVTLVAIFR